MTKIMRNLVPLYAPSTTQARKDSIVATGPGLHLRAGTSTDLAVISRMTKCAPGQDA
jgi:hypothetical protein